MYYKCSIDDNSPKNVTIMKKLLFLLLAAFIGLQCQAQMRMGLVKDQDGYTNIRKGPGTNYDSVDKVPDGMFINFTKGTNGWYKVYTTYTSGEEQQFLGYMAANKIVVPPRQGAWKQVAMVKDEDGYTNIRKGPGTKYAIVDKVKDGSYILISGEYDDAWYKVYTQKGVLRGYISAKKVLRMESPEF